MENSPISPSLPPSEPTQIPHEPHKPSRWKILAILIIIVLIAAPFLPSVMRNLKSSVLLGLPTVTAPNGAVSNIQGDDTGGTFQVSFNAAGESTIDVSLGGEKGSLKVNVEEPVVVAAATPSAPPDYGYGGMVPVPGAFPDAAPAAEPAGIIGVGAGGSAEPEAAAEKAKLESGEVEIAEEGENHGASEIPSPFADVKNETKYRDSILKLYELGAMTGTDSPVGLVFNPMSDIDRAQFATVMNRISNRFPELTDIEANIAPEDCNFPDYEPGKWYIEPVTEACLKAIVEGYPDGTFRPIEFINYAEAIAVAIRAASQYSDAVAIELARQKSVRVEGEGQWYDAYVDTALELGIVTEEAWTEVEEKKPWGNATRGFIADLIAHMPDLE